MIDIITLGLVGILILLVFYALWRFRNTPSFFSLSTDINKLRSWKTNMEERFSTHLLHYNDFQTKAYESFRDIDDKLGKLNAGISRIDAQYTWFKSEWKEQKDEFMHFGKHFDEQARLLNRVLNTVAELQQNAKSDT